jgi:hypothetical protein
MTRDAIVPHDAKSCSASYTDSNGGITIDILSTEYHRGCSIAYCIQKDKKTEGLRYIVYGVYIKEAEDYGIGTSLCDFNIKNTIHHCPNNVTARHVNL